jgi:hypothetical protein
VAVNGGAFEGISESEHKAVQPFPQTRHAILTHFSADAHGEVIRARERPNIAFKLFEKLRAQQIIVAGHVIAKGEHEIAPAARMR